MIPAKNIPSPVKLIVLADETVASVVYDEEVIRTGAFKK
jgi:hypothetical protein